MANSYFEFKQFTINQGNTAMKVGTDGVLLGAWAKIKNASTILDIGTGTGLIAIMSAQRNSSALIDAVEIDDSSSRQAIENVNNCPWSSRISVYNKALQDFYPMLKYDSIISNPPFFINSTKASCSKKSTARHTDTLSFDDIIFFAVKNLSEKGVLNIILPVVEGELFIKKAAVKGLFCSKKTFIFPNSETKAHRLLLEFSLIENVTDISHFTIETLQRHYYTEEYKNLTGEFYTRLR